MSVSSHLTPEPERRLRLILEDMRHAAAAQETRVGALTAFAAGELFLLKALAPSGWGLGARILLAAALPLGVYAFAPMRGSPDEFPFRKPKEHPRDTDALVGAEALAKHSHSELIRRLDFYLGGGVTATPYYEDLVGQIVAAARVASRKRMLLKALSALVGVAQLALLAPLLR